jgi:hypothetical protein
MRELQRRRQASNAFAGRHGFITPRDLFRWAERGAVGYAELAEHGAMILGERLRSAEERAVVVEVLQRVMKVQVRKTRCVCSCEREEENNGFFCPLFPHSSTCLPVPHTKQPSMPLSSGLRDWRPPQWAEGLDKPATSNPLLPLCCGLTPCC